MSEHQQTQLSKESKPTFQKQAFPTKQMLISNPSAIIHRARINPKSLTHVDVLQFQRTIGNMAVGRLFSEIGAVPQMVKQAKIQRQEIPEKEHLQGKIIDTVQRQGVQERIKSGTLQAKLKIGQPNDIYEQEADRVAEQVMRMPDPVLQRRCPKCDEDKRKVLQTKKVAGQVSHSQGKDVHPIVQDVLSSPSQPLDLATRAFMEPRFGHDFSRVRVHTDAKAAESAKNVHALAYTVGTDVVFGAGQQASQSGNDRKLLAHELTHVIQQDRGNLSYDPQNTLRAEQLQRQVASPVSDHLQSPRFVPSAKLEHCYEDTDRLRKGDPDIDAVMRIQQALIDVQGITGNAYNLGVSGPSKDGVDGMYGPKTAAAVKKFKSDEVLGSTQFDDVGPGVMHRLDSLFQLSVPPGPQPVSAKNPIPQPVSAKNPIPQPVSAKNPRTEWEDCLDVPDLSYPPRARFTYKERNLVYFSLCEARSRASLACMNLQHNDPYHLKMARRIFGETVTLPTLKNNCKKILDSLNSLKLEDNLVRGTCDEPECRPGGYSVALAATLEPDLTTIAICPHFFRVLPRQWDITLLHEAGHKARIDPAVTEGAELYCSNTGESIDCCDVCPKSRNGGN